MGTWGNVVFFQGGKKKPVRCIHSACDSYPEGLGRQLADLLLKSYYVTPFEEIVETVTAEILAGREQTSVEAVEPLPRCCYQYEVYSDMTVHAFEAGPNLTSEGAKYFHKGNMAGFYSVVFREVSHDKERHRGRDEAEHLMLEREKKIAESEWELASWREHRCTITTVEALEKKLGIAASQWDLDRIARCYNSGDEQSAVDGPSPSEQKDAEIGSIHTAVHGLLSKADLVRRAITSQHDALSQLLYGTDAVPRRLDTVLEIVKMQTELSHIASMLRSKLIPKSRPGDGTSE